jgi:LCP family protein required for cell wall assembly
MNPLFFRKTMRKTLKIAGVFAVFFIIGVLVYAGYVYNKANAAIQQISLQLNPASNSISEHSPSLGNEQKTNIKPFTLLLTAVDDRKGNEGSLNTDVIMLASVNPQTHTATIVSIPRDLEVQAIQSGLADSHKINYFYAYYYNKDKETAITHTKSMFSDLYGVPIDYMAVINFDGFRQMVDQLGGIKVDVDIDMKYVDESDGTSINLKQGLQTLSGKQSLDFLRYRKSNQGTEESSDMARNERQQLVLAQLLNKLTSVQGITGWGKLFDIAGKSIQTDIPADQMRNFAASYQKLKPDTTEFIHLDGEWKSPYVIVKEQDLQHAADALRSRLAQPPQNGASIDK